MNPPHRNNLPWTRSSLADLLRMQKKLFMEEIYGSLDEEDDTQHRVFEAVKNTFELCAKIVEGQSMVGYMDTGSEGLSH